MKESLLVSVITVVYNGEKYLQQTIDSVAGQTYDNIEYIIIDGGSTDGTLGIIRNNLGHISKWISEPDEGIYDAMNKGIKLANGDLIGIINSDDWFAPNAIKEVVDAYKKNKDKKVFHGDRYDIKSNKKKRLYRFNPSKFKFLYFSMTYNHPSMFFHREIYESVKYNTKLRVFSDYELVLKLFLKDPSIFCYIPIAYVNYRLEGISTQQTFFNYTREGARARLNAGLSPFHVAIHIALRSIYHVLKIVTKTDMKLRKK